mgnify:FL=1|tara:strand:+ start:1152 stop:1442 length:291 start_codon:yes stop_codon:yes gene_type:complete
MFSGYSFSSFFNIKFDNLIIVTMKKIIFLLLLSSCSVNKDNIFYTKSVKKSIHNLEVLESWIHRDLENGDIPKKLADDYMIAVTHTRLSLEKKYKK